MPDRPNVLVIMTDEERYLTPTSHVDVLLTLLGLAHLRPDDLAPAVADRQSRPTTWWAGTSRLR